ncbi:SDR family oxidoreductase [Bacillus sp. BRMEA1]|uniref:dTDP-4-dehydrorhamnose reductase family protein n=1 Tax=Neobacillus endophyticus TaxID=2738405 RepID=UPI0015650B75|nr:SDR family oxidoreductase [Neobacillus endophyticus]NRD76714.1 SDR family oxidoreductase [Neobacillus endophyticus]
MKLLVLGGNGMAGHMITRYFKTCPGFSVYYTSRDASDLEAIQLDARDQAVLESVIDSLKPDFIINCVGILNENANKNPIDALLLNSVLPHTLAKLADRCGGRLIHISTDCVFSGKKGDYEEHDPTDGEKVYGKTKALGEIVNSRHLTIRTSIIGPEIRGEGIGLMHWFMQQTGEIKGFKRVFWNGVTTLELAKVIQEMMKQNISGLYHLCVPEKISKYDLLRLFQDVFDKKDVVIHPDEKVVLDRSLKNNRTDFHYQVPEYKTMLLELRDWLNQQ